LGPSSLTISVTSFGVGRFTSSFSFVYAMPRPVAALNVPENVPATGLRGPHPSQRQPTRKQKSVGKSATYRRAEYGQRD
jgi:hypothetical protein